VIYHEKDIIGVFMLQHFPELIGLSEKPYTSFYFSFQKNNIPEMSTFFSNTILKIADESLEFKLFGDCRVLVHKNNIFIKSSLQEKLGLNCSSWSNYLECEIFQVEGMLN
jgi:hypothetical protein